ncbi:sigma-70 family RNA polymerase sigma factor [Sphingomonas mali]|uniref:sigma-70 family RNA polymerase sigma factor n=1 Tax=Sphingomonas mali TaxID=40682 RepID=UPI00082B447E|nr:sigma-70 family RNA polymerase sigma factor [Sphingomonas mali]
MTDEKDRARIEALLVELRPALHRYAARMVGSVLDGEDVVQDAIARAMAALDRAPPEGDATAWSFRIAHNAAIDHLRARARRGGEQEIQEEDMISDGDEAARRCAAGAALAVFMQLPPLQRGTVILKDVLGYSNEEAAGILDTTLAATKAALHRGRARLRILADAPSPLPPADHGDVIRLQAYVDRFNARDFDAVRAMLADDVRFELVARMTRGRAAFETYFTRYTEMTSWRLSVGVIEGRAAAIVHDPADPTGPPTGLIVIDWADGRIVRLRDFYHARYVLRDAVISPPA